MTNDEHQIQKMKYHIRQLAEALDSKTHPIASLVIEKDWSHDDLEAAHDIFEKYADLLDKNELVNWTAFEHELRKKFNIGYQEVKSIILAFYRNGQWREVCVGYTIAHTSVELHEILNDFKRDPIQLTFLVQKTLERLDYKFQSESDGADFLLTLDGKTVVLEIVEAQPRGTTQGHLAKKLTQLQLLRDRKRADFAILVVPDASFVKEVKSKIPMIHVCSIFDLEGTLKNINALKPS